MVATRHAEAQAEQAAVKTFARTTCGRHQQPLDDSDAADSSNEGSEHMTDDEAAAAAAAGAGGRSARAGRSLRDTVRKPPAMVVQAFTREPTPPRQLSRAERRDQERERREQQRRQEAQLLELAQQQQEVQTALRAAATGSHLTRHQTKLLRMWSEGQADLQPATVDAAAAGDADAAALLAVAAAAALEQQSERGSDIGDEGVVEEEEGWEGDPDGAAAGVGRSLRRRPPAAAAAAAAAAAVSGGAATGLKRELLQLKQAAAEAKAAERRRRQREAIREAARQQRVLLEQRGPGSRRASLDDVVLEYSSDEGADADSSSQEDAGDEEFGGRRLRKRRRVAASSDEGSEGDEEEEDEGKKNYPLRSRERTHSGRANPAAAKPSRPKPREQRRSHVRVRQHRRGGFSDVSSGDPDEGLFHGRHWNRLLAAASAGPPGPFYAPSGLPPTPAAAAAAAGGMLSPRAASLDRRGSAFLDAPPGTASRGTGSGWGHWAGAGGSADGFGGGGSGGAAAAAGGTAADKRGAGLGQELITPLQVDPSIDFDQIGGLDQYLSALKEMVFLPLLYPEIFDKFGVSPPRGVLFHGPPGTGKTLVARALAAQASRAAGQKVSFYMRKGADLLSKWVGEAEKQLRLLFEEASKHQPAIIFFDEIDGLAPVRTSKQDQVHNSIVSTLLALMDGLESRGRVVLIGATNRPDALDPALRRPGRFDRELLFPMPDLAARRSILTIHSRHWTPQPAPALLDDLAQRTGGYCGADLRALCAEASLAALRRTYPQIYASDVKLLIDPSAVNVSRQDFLAAMKELTPAAHRATASHAKALSSVIQPCLSAPLASALQQIQQLFPPAAACIAATAAAAAGDRSSGNTGVLAKMGGVGSSSSGSSSGGWQPHVSRPRMLLAGPPGSGQQQLGAAVLAALEGLPVHCIGLTSLLANVSARCVEEALVSAFTEARRSAPAVIYWPQAHMWWAAAGSGLRCALVALLDDMPSDTPLLLLATAEFPATDPDSAAAGRSKSSNSRRLLTGPLTITSAAAAAGCSNAGKADQLQQQADLEVLGMEPSLAALFPALGQLSDIKALLCDLQQPAGQQQMQAEDAAAAAGCDVMGWVLLESPGAPQRRKMFQGIFDAAAAPPAPEQEVAAQQQHLALPPAPDAAAAAEAQRKAEEAAAARVAYEEDQAVVRALRMILRGIVQRALTLKRYRMFAEPPLCDEAEGMQALQSLTQPMDLLTMLHKVDHQQYITPAAFLADAHLIIKCAEELYSHTEAAAVIQAPQPTPEAFGGAGEAAAAAAAAAAAVGRTNTAEDDPMLWSPDGLVPAAAGPSAAAAAAAGMSARVLPAVRVSVCKEISRAVELKDVLEQQVYQLVPPDLAQACEALAARGGPAAPPPGMMLPQQLLDSRLQASNAVRMGDAGGKPTRTTARSTGHKLDKGLLHADPEALMRARRQSKAKAQPTPAAAAAAAAGGGGLEGEEGVPEEQPATEQAQQAAQQPVAAATDAGVDTNAAAAGAAAGDAADNDPAGAAEAHVTPQQQQQQAVLQQEESPAALKPVTNGVSRKRRGSSAEATPAELEAGRTAKAPRHADAPPPPQQQQQGLGMSAGNSRDGMELDQQPGGAADQPHQQQQQQDQQQQGQQLNSLQRQQQGMAGGSPVEVLQPPTVPPSQPAAVADVQLAGELLDRTVAATAGMQLSALELLHARLSRVVAAHCHEKDRSSVLQQLSAVVESLQGCLQL